MSDVDKSVEDPGFKDRRDPSPANKYRRSIFGVPITLTVSVGEARLSVAEILQLHQDTIVPLGTRIDDPIELKIEDKLIAYGDLVETEAGGLALKITEIIEDADAAQD